MRLSLGCFGACWVAGLLPVFSGVLVSKSLIINGVSFSGNVAVLLVALGSSTSSGHSGWYWRNAFLSPSNMVSRFSGFLPVFSCVLVSKSLVINGISFCGNEALVANGAVVVGC